VGAVYDRLVGVPEQLMFITQMVENNAAASNLQGVLLHCRVLYDMALRLRADPLAELVIGICERRQIPEKAMLGDLRTRASEVADQVLDHMNTISAQSSLL